jgi:small conductance mechanosensitive channel
VVWWNDDYVALGLTMALNVLYAAAILIAAFFLSGWLKARIGLIAARHPRIDAMLFGFLGSLAQYAVLAFAVVFVLNRFGIQTASLVALIGAAGLAVGLALQGTLTNLAAGVMLVLFRPFRVGDYVSAAGQSGTVKTVALFYTELATYDGIQVIVPNGDIWASAITNYSVNPLRLVDLTIRVAYESDLRKVDRVLSEVIAAESRALAEPAPFVKVGELGPSSVDFVVRVWTLRGDWWATKCDLTRAIKDRFDAEAIEIPYPAQKLVTPPAPPSEPPPPQILPAE